jgi:hypothetical protein
MYSGQPNPVVSCVLIEDMREEEAVENRLVPRQGCRGRGDAYEVLKARLLACRRISWLLSAVFYYMHLSNYVESRRCCRLRLHPVSSYLDHPNPPTMQIK